MSFGIFRYLLQDASTRPTEAYQIAVKWHICFSTVSQSLITIHSSSPWGQIETWLVFSYALETFSIFVSKGFYLLVRMMFFTHGCIFKSLGNYITSSVSHCRPIKTKYVGMVSKYQCTTLQTILMGSQRWEPLHNCSASQTLCIWLKLRFCFSMCGAGPEITSF